MWYGSVILLWYLLCCLEGSGRGEWLGNEGCNIFIYFFNIFENLKVVVGKCGFDKCEDLDFVSR